MPCDFVRHDLVAAHRRRAALDAEQRRHAGAVDVAVHQADPAPPSRCRPTARFTAIVLLPDAALARADGDDVLHLREWVRIAAAGLRACPGQPGCGSRPQNHLNALGPGTPQGGFHVRFDLLLLGRSRHGHLHHHPGMVSLDVDFLDEAQRNEVLEEIRVLHRPQGRHNLIARQCHVIPVLFRLFRLRSGLAMPHHAPGSSRQL